MRTTLGLGLALFTSAFIALACSSEGADSAGHATNTGGEATASGGGSQTGGTSSGGANGSGGLTNSGGVTNTGGATSSGGADLGGAPGDGGTPASGGTDTGGSASGGSASGGTASGGSASGGTGPVELGAATVWIAGDSTVANGNTPCPVGWGKSFDSLFDDRITVVNSAVGGRSVRTWLYDVQSTADATGECVRTLDASQQPVLQQRWQDMLKGMKKGDFLLIQFGINDGDTKCPRHVGLNAFKESYGMMAKAAKDRGAQPVFITPVSAIACNGSTPKGTRGFVQATIDVGAQYGVPVIDLHAASVALYGKLGFCPIPGGDVSATTGGAVGAFFCDDHTHFDATGAVQIADLVAEGLKSKGVALAEYLK